jgi:hypothetical protein
MQITAQGTEEEIEDTIDSFEDLVNWFTYDSNNYQRSDDDGFEDTL